VISPAASHEGVIVAGRYGMVMSTSLAHPGAIVWLLLSHQSSLRTATWSAVADTGSSMVPSS
jgi:hypothetical protein